MHLRVIALTALSAWTASAAVLKQDTALEKRDDYACNSAHAPGNPSDCDNLYNDIASGTAFANLQTANPRTLRNGSCFVSWSNNVVGASQDLLPYISALKNGCTSQHESGIVKNVHLYGQSQATAICLSNRGTGCEN
ncbi:hypothetical protein NQ176_g6643 [Zarea fungicola]|uniref:Uncharacterized protein n=1 Tax=Zarea fungicola TaxID=93591 RepID=A0ACC1N3F5_9HYPO|nr:hypothetical protein NQ176_g6643 [Lecanicillium fungicola]